MNLKNGQNNRKTMEKPVVIDVDGPAQSSCARGLDLAMGSSARSPAQKPEHGPENVGPTAGPGMGSPKTPFNTMTRPAA
jgi:hypothetical protein